MNPRTLFKEGDEIVCIKDFYFDYSNLVGGNHSEDVSYTAWKRYKVIFFGVTTMGQDVMIVVILDDRGKRFIFYHEFVSKQITPLEPALFEYFMHPTELRKLKLDKLNE